MAIYLGNTLIADLTIGSGNIASIYRGSEIVFGNPNLGVLELELNPATASSYPGTGTLWTDISGRGNNFTLSGSFTYSNNAIQLNSGFPAGLGYAVNSNQSVFNVGGGPFSIFAMVRSRNINTVSQVFSKQNFPDSFTGYAMGFTQIGPPSGDNGCFGLDLFQDGAGRLIKQTSGSLNQNQWYGLTATYDGSALADGINLYINGISGSVPLIVRDSTGAGSITNLDNTENTFIGARTNDNPIENPIQPLSGSIGAVQFYKRVLESTEISNLYNLYSASFTN
jgi:hypothetical protein